MKFERVVIEDGTANRFIDIHPRLTIVAGLDAADRRVLLAELRNALGPHRDGVHLELRTDDGRQLAVFRGRSGDHRVIDIENAVDLTSGFLDASGLVDPAAGLHLDDSRLVIDEGVLANRLDDDRHLDVLTGLDQQALWDILDRLTGTEAIMAEAERAHAETPVEVPEEVTAELYDSYYASSRPLPRFTIPAIAAAVLTVIAAGVLYGQGVGLVALMLGAVGLIALGYFGYPLLRRLLAQKAAASALEQVGAESILSFQLRQVDGMLAQDERRKTLREADADHEAALADWNELVGDIDPAFAQAHASAIRIGAAIRANDETDDPTTGFLHPTTPLLLRCVGSLDSETESLPRILDAPFGDLDEATRASLVAALNEASASRQIVLLASEGEAEVASWTAQLSPDEVSVVPGLINTAELVDS